ncbi:pantoate--beta-alanine ligase [Thalassoglobus polymorphus]|nr:pantoate--beta-alanine ligase [Thalassoglobus polymorphus]
MIDSPYIYEGNVKDRSMQVTGEIAEIREAIARSRQQGCQIGCVPTMGALHAGHISLVEECRKRVDYVLVTIFVNPTQFGQGEDLDKYPRPLEADLDACRAAGVSCVYTPEIPSLYPDGYGTWVDVEGMSTILEGECRPDHFRGVTTIVAKLLNIIQPDVACFGAKDYQQQTLIRQMVRDLNMPIEVVVAPTVREADGLAMSSRNQYLSPEQRQTALCLSQALNIAEESLLAGETSIAQVEKRMLDHINSFDDVRPEYTVLRDPDTLEELKSLQPEMVALIATYVGQTRLIDNRRISLPQ